MKDKNKQKANPQDQLETLNPLLKEMGMCEFRMVNPKECRGQEMNARYMPSEMFVQLMENIKSDGRLESIPLCYEDEHGSIRIISGHHRIKACEELGLESILVMLAEPNSEDEIISKQLSHNAISGKDDEQVLQSLFDKISDVNLKMMSGLSSEIDKITYQSINFKIGGFKEFTLGFVPEDILNYDEKMEEIASSMKSNASSNVRIVPFEDYEKFGKLLRKIKKNENIKSNGPAFTRMLELAAQKLKEDGVQ